MKTAIYLAHLNPVTNAHVEIIQDLKKENKVVVMPVRFLKEKNEVNSKSFPFNFEVRKKMLESVFGDSIIVSSNYTFFAPFKKYFPPLISLKSWSLRKQILQGIENDYFTYTGNNQRKLEYSQKICYYRRYDYKNHWDEISERRLQFKID